MPVKEYRVWFTRSSCGRAGTDISPQVREQFDLHGPHLPAIHLGDDDYQVRDLTRVGTVWTGVFAKLRADAPHVVDMNDAESELDLDEGSRLIDKCHFILRERQNLFVWQYNKSAGSLNKFATYWSQLLDTLVSLPYVMNDAELEEKLQGQLYELIFAYDRPPQLNAAAPRWNRNAFDMMASADAAHAKFSLRAPRNGSLAEASKNWIRRMVNDGVHGFAKVRIRMTDDTNPVEVFMAPLKDSISVQLVGRYPDATQVYQELEGAYDRKRGVIA